MWIALFVNAIMFAVELAAGLRAESVSLLADAIDFLGDAGNYGLSLAALGMASVWRSRTALIKGLTMGTYGIAIVGRVGWQHCTGLSPNRSRWAR
ncbi:cation transporter [Pseudoduganella sp. UC29_106]|uniref:cation transporter n=1 Tax=Pseudoduganella sp. UC29_106 TaxID=3374553 RepID=UPI00375787A6